MSNILWFLVMHKLKNNEPKVLISVVYYSCICHLFIFFIKETIFPLDAGDFCNSFAHEQQITYVKKRNCENAMCIVI